MLAMMSVIVKTFVSTCFLTFIFYRRGPNVARPVVTPPYSTTWRAWVH